MPVVDAGLDMRGLLPYQYQRFITCRGSQVCSTRTRMRCAESGWCSVPVVGSGAGMASADMEAR